MPIADAVKRKIGRELVDWIYLGVRAGARRSASEYERLKSTDADTALAHLKRAMNMPRRARERINAARDRFISRGGTASGFNSFIGSCLTLAGTVTLSELNAELLALEAQADDLIIQRISGTMTLDQIADWIDSNWSDDVIEWSFPLPTGYEDQ